MLHARIEEIILTSGGSESNNYAIKGVARAYRKKGRHIITSAVEHPAVLEVCRYLEDNGYQITYLPVDGDGLIDPGQVEQAITPQTILISIMHANNEVGTIEPIREIAEIAHRRGIVVHTDAAQSIGKIPVHVDELQVDLLSIAGHKLYAPKGIGALYIRTGTRLEKLIHGASHEMNMRAGTENVIEIVGLGEACAMIAENLGAYQEHTRKMRDRLETRLRERFPDVRINGHPEKRLPNTANMSFRGLEANTILSELRNVAASAGAACHSDHVTVSSVLEAMHVPLEYAMGTIRFSVGRFTTAQEIDRALEEVAQVIEKLQPKEKLPAAPESSQQVKLTRYTHGLGCACKLRPQLLEDVLKKMPIPVDKNILVGTDTADDAAVYRLNDETAIVQTVDFFTPVVDDPYQFGVIAAANSLSDIYAMGGKPLFALNIVGFPSNRLPVSVLEEILRGAGDVAEQAGISIIGGHTVDDTEPKFGLTVTGLVDPRKVVTNRTARPGDKLVLTKRIGTGILSTALKQDLLEPEYAEQLVSSMASLNNVAAEAMQTISVSACTDITGFGLLGHLLEMMTGSNASADIEASNVLLLPGAVELAASGVIPGGTRDNLAYTAPFTDYTDAVSEVTRLILNDAQTSGGLLISVPAEKAIALLELLNKKGIADAAIIGEVRPDNQIRIAVHE
jgi:selenium donor protein